MSKRPNYPQRYDLADDKKHISQLWGDDGVGGYTKKENITFKTLQKMLPNFKGGSVLEVGPGTGQLA